MRIKHFFGLAVLAAMTASCSSNNDLVNGGNGSGRADALNILFVNICVVQL